MQSLHGIGKPRLLVVTSTMPARRGDGTPSFVWDLAERVADRFEVTVLAPMIRGAAREERTGQLSIKRFRYFLSRYEDLADGAILENLRRDPKRWLQVPPLMVAEAVAVRRAIRRINPDVVHVHWLIPQGVVVRFVAPRIQKVVTTLGGDVYALRGSIARALKRTVIRNADAVTVMNKEMAQRMIDLGADPVDTYIIPMGAEPTPREDGRPSPSREEDRVLFAGRMVEKKGATVLLRARGLATRTWKTQMVGDGPLLSDIKRQVRSSPEVTLSGALPRSALADAMVRCAVFALPSVRAATGDQDGLPVVLLEAMAAGCPIVASRLPGIDEVIVDGVNGLLVPPGEPAPLAEAIDRLLSDRSLANRLGSAAAETAKSFSAEAIGERYAELLEKVAKRRQKL